MAIPTAAQVAAFLGRGDDTTVVALAGEHLPIVTAFVEAYVRGDGFDDTTGEPAAPLAQVIISATARLTANPEQARQVTVSDYAETPAVLNGFTLPELAVLHRFRRRAL